jgi:hypothetical protein
MDRGKILALILIASAAIGGAVGCSTCGGLGPGRNTTTKERSANARLGQAETVADWIAQPRPGSGEGTSRRR